MKAYYEQLFAYKQLLEHGSNEMKSKVQELVEEYHQYLKGGMKDTGVRWEFRKREEDIEDRPRNEFGIVILSKETPDKSVQLEVMTNFDFNDSRYKYALTNNAYRLVRIYEKEHRSMFADAKMGEFYLIKRDNEYILKTMAGNVLWPHEAKSTKEVIVSREVAEKE